MDIQAGFCLVDHLDVFDTIHHEARKEHVATICLSTVLASVSSLMCHAIKRAIDFALTQYLDLSP